MGGNIKKLLLSVVMGAIVAWFYYYRFNSYQGDGFGGFAMVFELFAIVVVVIPLFFGIYGFIFSRGKRLKRSLISLLLALAGSVIVITTLIIWQPYANNNPEPTGGEIYSFPKSIITTFEKCVEAGNAVMKSFPEKCRAKDGTTFINWQGADRFCVQVITPARNPETGEVRKFPTPCDVPEEWEEL